MQHAPNIKEPEKYEVVSFGQSNTLKVKERTERSQTSDFIVSSVIAAWRA